LISLNKYSTDRINILNHKNSRLKNWENCRNSNLWFKWKTTWKIKQYWFLWVIQIWAMLKIIPKHTRISKSWFNSNFFKL